MMHSIRMYSSLPGFSAAVLVMLLIVFGLQCQKKDRFTAEQDHTPSSEEVLYIDLEDISFYSISNIMLEAIKSYDMNARLARLEIIINIEDGIKDLRAVLFNDDTHTRYVCSIDDNKLIVMENPALFQAPIIVIEDIGADYPDIMENISLLDDEELKYFIDNFSMSRIIFFSRQERPTYMLKYVNPKNQNQSIVFYFDSKTGELYQNEKFGF